ncbi:MAG: 3'-5' exonuclease, partial [Simplicispira sp.]|nr:3'-5' exonuclease [Simplicispira sp.]
DSVTEPRTREALMQALVFFCGARIVVQGREDESQQALLQDAIRSVTDNPHFLQHFFHNQILANADPAMQRRLRHALQVAQAPTAPALLARLLQALEMDAIIKEVLVSRERRQEAQGNVAGLCSAAQGFDSARDYFLHLNRAEQKQGERKRSASLLLASITHVKGLEFAHVVIPHLERGVFPAPQAPLGEEQNLLYVGMTRARQQLTLLVQRERPSSLVQQMGYAVSKAPPAGQ